MYNFRSIYENMVNYQGENPYQEIILPFLKDLPQNIWSQNYLQEIQTTEQIPKFDQEEIWRLYSFHRFNELLLLNFQEPKISQLNHALKINSQEYRSLMSALGLEVLSYPKFLPIFHQIVEVEYNQNPDAEIEIIEEFWPTLKLQNLVVSRASCKIRAGKNKINKKIAENSTLYWSHRRLNRKYNDESLGWGHNSQWRTQFRRDYILDNCIVYNHDADIIICNNQYIFANEDVKNKFDTGFYQEDFTNFTNDQIVELVTNRNFIFSDKDNIEAYPYDFGCIIDLLR